MEFGYTLHIFNKGANMKTSDKFTLLTASASSLKDDIKTIALFLEVSKVLTAADLNSKLSPPGQYDFFFSLNINVFLGFEELSFDCHTWFENNGFPLDDEE